MSKTHSSRSKYAFLCLLLPLIATATQAREQFNTQALPPSPSKSVIETALMTVPSSVAFSHMISHDDPPSASPSVKLAVTIDPGGTVSRVSLIQGDPASASAAQQAVHTWRYKPFTVDGKLVRVRIIVDVPFSMRDANQNDCLAAYEVRQYSSAAAACKDAAAAIDEVATKPSEEQFRIHDLYGQVLLADQDPPNALGQFKKGLALARRLKNRGLLTIAYRHTATASDLAGFSSDALKYYGSAELILREDLDESPEARQDMSDRTLAHVLRQHAALLSRLGRAHEAERLKHEAASID